MAGSVLTFGQPEREFAMIRNDFIRNPAIKPGAFRVALYVYSTSREFRLTQASIARALDMNETTIRSAFKHLEELRYLVRVPQRDASGHRAADDLFLNQVPFTDEERAQLLGSESQPGENQGWDLQAGESPAPKKINSTQKTKTQEHEGSSSSADDGLFEPPSEAPKPKTAAALEAEFEAWWMHYPRKVGKGSALRAFKTARKMASVTELHDGLGAAIRAWDAARTETQYKPHPATWLNRQGWLDDPAAVASAQTSPNRRAMPGPGVVHTQEEIAQQERAFAAMPAATMLTPEEAEALMQELEMRP